MLTVDPWGSIRRPSDKPTGTIICDAPLTKLAPAPRITAPSSGKSKVCVMARFHAGKRDRAPRPRWIEEAHPEPEVEPAARHAVRTLDRGAAAVGEAQQQADFGALESAIGSVERRRARRLRGRAPGAGQQTGADQQRKVTPHARLLSDQKRTPPVRMNVLPPPISPRPSTNGVSVLRFTLNVVPPSRFSPAFVAPEPLTPVTDAWATFSPPPA